MFRPIAAIFRLLQFCSKSIIYMLIFRGDAEMILFEQNCNNLMMAVLAETCSYFLLLNTIINPYYHSCGVMTDIYLTTSLSTHNGGDTTQNSYIDFYSDNKTPKYFRSDCIPIQTGSCE